MKSLWALIPNHCWLRRHHTLFTCWGKLGTPGRIQLDGPTTVLGAIASAGGHQIGGNLRQVVVFRRAEDWRIISTMLDVQGASTGQTSHADR